MKNNFKVILVIIGAFIGAGFASGKEIYTFFCIYGKNGIISLCISTFLFSIVVYKALNIIKEKNIKNYNNFLSFIIKRNNKYLKALINNIINILILISFFIMIAGFGSYFNQEYGINNYVGSGFLALISYIVLKNGTNRLVKINQILVPIIIGSIFIIGILLIKKSQLIIIENNINRGFLKSGILYSSYNSIMIIPILVTVKDYINSKKSIFFISMVSGIIVFVLSIFMFFLLNNNSYELQNIDIPMIYILNGNIILKNIYGVVILLAISTTAISLGSAFIKNVSDNKNNYPHIAKIICIVAVVVSLFGFSNLINLLYPIFGYIGIVQILKLFI
ncbi:MAG: hypothetical protein IJH39_06220 [Clostridia bacterium]|nr:hypothetical protein [Clostridia bacterium]